jgi:hypothetical protein
LINFFNARLTFQVSILMKVQVPLDGPLLHLGGDSAFSESEGLVTGGDDPDKLWHTNKNIWTSLVDQWKKTGRLRPKSDAMNINIDAPWGAFGDQPKTQRSNSDAMSICEDAPKPELRGQSTNLSKTSERTRRETGTKDAEIGCFVADASRVARVFDRRQSDPTSNFLDEKDFDFRTPGRFTQRRRAMTESEALCCDAKRALPEEFQTAFEIGGKEIMSVNNAVNQESDIGEDFMDQKSAIDEDEYGSVQKIRPPQGNKGKGKSGDGVFPEIGTIELVRPRDISDATTIQIRGCNTLIEDIYEE